MGAREARVRVRSFQVHDLSRRALIGIMSTAFLAVLLRAPSVRPEDKVADAVSLEEETKQLVVMIDAKLADEPTRGAGIIVGRSGDDLFVVTANHVVRRGNREAEDIRIRFRWQSDTPIQAKLLTHKDQASDLAILGVSDAKSLKKRVIELPFDRASDPKALKRGDPIYLLGYPGGLPWRSHTTPERFSGMRESHLEFESNLIAPGHSGGVMLNGAWDVVGMLLSDTPPYGDAVSISAILKLVSEWGYPTNLRTSRARISAGFDLMLCYLNKDGVARCWGGPPALPKVSAIPDVRLKSISAGNNFVCGVDHIGSAYCIGNNRYGQLGNGTASGDKDDLRGYETARPVQGGLPFASISAGVGHVCGIAADGRAYCWGFGENGQLGDGLARNSSVPVAVAGGLKFASISAGWLYSCAVTDQGIVYCWGSGGSLDFGSSVPVQETARGKSFKSVKASYSHACALTTDGAIHCAGFNDDGQLGVGSKGGFSATWEKVPLPHRFKAVSTRGSFTCGITIRGVAYCWGSNNFGQLGSGSTAKDSPQPAAVAGAISFESLDAGNIHACGITTDDALYCWGYNAIGGVGPLKHSESAVPVRIPLEDVLPLR
jgi:hypothetical protein